MSRSMRRGGFTLVELLVVITVIAMLMALLFPAIGAITRAAQKTQCLDHLHSIGTACLTYETTRGWYPPEYQTKFILPSNPSSGQSQATLDQTQVLWPALLLGNLDRGDLAQNLRNYTGDWAVYMEVFVCPANPPDSQSVPALGYACNGGQKNGAGSATIPPDWKENGVFMPNDVNAKKLFSKVTKDFITTHDGLDTTLLILDIGRNGSWNGNPVLVEGLPAANTTPSTTPMNSATWALTPNQAAINDKTNGKFTGQFASLHSGGACVAMASSKTMFLSEQVDINVLNLLFTTYGAAAKQAGTTTANAQTATLKAGDLDK